MSIQVEHLTKRFGEFIALDNIDLEVKTGELVALLGPSGSGKTTMLRCIAGLESPDAGAIRFHGEDALHRNVRQRGVGFVFQHYALFRHLTVFENVAFGLKVKPRRERLPRAEIKAKVDSLLGLVQLSGMAARYPSQLSGGQRQRVALARALAVEPKVLLLDEPFGALDAKVRLELRRWLRRLHDEMHITSVFVTHDQDEALEVADRVVVMNHGRVEQVGTPEAVYSHPANPFVYGFLGNVNLFHGRVQAGSADLDGMMLSTPQVAAMPDSVVVGYARPHDLEVSRRNGGGGIEATVRHIRALGPVVRLHLERDDLSDDLEAIISAERFKELNLKEGEAVSVTPRNVRVFADDYSI